MLLANSLQGFSRQTELFQYLHRNFAGRAKLSGNECIRFLVGSGAFLEECVDFFEGIPVLKQRAMSLVANALPNRFRRGPQTDDQSVFLESRKVFRVNDESA